ncbi:MAG: type 2 isopentenyl-diphosphate Delta-isomerase [Spirochaeta sp. LUC14_002_19_P3]|nr:MAG: type 2 isopentenyl-diphosphate Delta-isomerase [Spirochaeta sp. LUC14_002_19_P3]
MMEISERKQRHIEICLSEPVESGDTELGRIRLPHRAMPEIDSAAVSPATDFLGFRLKLPLLVSSMSGGTPEGYKLNRELAEIAGEEGIAFSTGSIRVMLEHSETLPHFRMKPLAPQVPVLANIGAAQLLEYPHKTIIDAVKRIEADGIFIHLNAAQEFFQHSGDRNFLGWFDAIRRFLDKAEFPVLIKETGCGIAPAEGLKLLEAGAAYIDIAGSGGTDWVAVETLRKPEADRAAGNAFRGWGYPTGLLLLAYRRIAESGGKAGKRVSGRIIASGGLRSPLDFALSLACGAALAAAALPFIRTARRGEARRFIAAAGEGIRAALALTGAGTLDKLRAIPLMVPSDLEMRAIKLTEEIDRLGTSKKPI